MTRFDFEHATTFHAHDKNSFEVFLILKHSDGSFSKAFIGSVFGYPNALAIAANEWATQKTADAFHCIIFNNGSIMPYILDRDLCRMTFDNPKSTDHEA